VQIEELAGHVLEDEPFQAPQIEQRVAKRLLDGGQKRRFGIGAFEIEQPAQLRHAAPGCAVLERGHVRIEHAMAPEQCLLLGRGTCAMAPARRGMVRAHETHGILLADAPAVLGHGPVLEEYQDLLEVLVHLHGFGHEALRN
jgi:hypothetical protein